MRLSIHTRPKSITYYKNDINYYYLPIIGIHIQYPTDNNYTVYR